MARKKAAAGLTGLERFGGGVFFVFYLLLLPLAAKPALGLLGNLLGRQISEDMGGAVYYYTLFAVTVILFHNLLAKTTRRFLDDPGLVLAWAYDHSGTLWASIGLHAGVNALSVLSGLNT